MLIEDSSANCRGCHNPLTWVGLSKRSGQNSVVYELDFRCEKCKCEYQFRDGKLRELKVERDPVAEKLAIRQAEIDAFRNSRCINCGGPLDDWLTCDWCHERYSVDEGVLIPRPGDSPRPKPKLSDFYALKR